MTSPDGATQSHMPDVPRPNERERVAQALSWHFAADHIGVDDLEQRLVAVYDARSRAALEAVVGNLPVLANDRMEFGIAPILAPAALVPARGVIMAVFGGASRKGSWLVPRHLKVVGVRVETFGAAFMGGFEASAGDASALDSSARVLRVSGLAMMAGVEIRVRGPGRKALARFEKAQQAANRLNDGDRL